MSEMTSKLYNFSTDQLIICRHSRLLLFAYKMIYIWFLALFYMIYYYCYHSIIHILFTPDKCWIIPVLKYQWSSLFALLVYSTDSSLETTMIKVFMYNCVSTHFA